MKCILNLNTNSKNEAFLFNKSQENILENYINNYWVKIWRLARSMTDKPAVKWQIIQMTMSLRLKHCLHMPYWEHVINQVQAKIFALSCLIPRYNRVSVTTNIKNSGYSQEFNKVNSVVRWKFRANLGQFCGRVRPHWKQIDVKRWGFIILSWNLQDLLHKVKEKRLKFLAIREKQFWNFLVTARMKLQGVTKKFHQYIKEKLTDLVYCG